MATVEEVASLVLSATDVSADKPIGISQAGQWVSERYRQLVARARFRHRRSLGVLTLPVAITDGTFAATRGSAALTADAEAQAAITAAGGGAAIVGRSIRLATTWYAIGAYASPTLTLSSAYGEPDATAAAYIIVQRYTALATDARWLGKFVHMRRRREIPFRSYADFDRLAPERMLTNDGPWYFAEASNAAGGGKRVELYPYSREVETIHYVYWPLPAALTLDDTIPQEIDPYVLREGALIDLFRYRASQSANAGQIEAAGYWRNESRAQQTSWEQNIQEAARTDRGVDDISYIYNILGVPTVGSRDIVDARDEVWARGLRP